MAKKEIGISFDFSEFEKEFREIVQREIPKKVADGLFRVGALILADAINEVPRAPHKTGALWRSQKVEEPEISEDEIKINCGFNIEYAARLHEGEKHWKWTLPGSGPKYLESKLSMFKDKYIQALARFLSEAKY